MKRIRRKTLIDHVCREERKFIPEDKKTFTALDLLEIEGFPDNVKINLAISVKGFIDPSILNEFACRCAERALSRIKHPDPRSVAAIEAKRKWIRGVVSDGELDAARAAAWDVVRYSARDVEDSAARAAAWAAAKGKDATMDAAGSSAWAAVWAVAGAAAWDAASAAAWDAERAWQVNELKKMLREAENNAGSN